MSDDGTMTRLPRQVSALAWVQLAPNPGPMTLDGTNTYLLRADAAGPAVVVDPGPDIPAHVDALAKTGDIELILVTHQHVDHTEAARALHLATGAPVRAASQQHCHGGEVLAGGERITAAGLCIDVLATPGHTADSVCFHLPDDGSVLTGDTVLGRGSTVIGIPDGTLAQYLDSLRLLRDLGPLLGLPAHGDALPDLAAACSGYLTHRLERLDQVRAVLAARGIEADPADDDVLAAVMADVYGDIEPGVAMAAAYSTATQLAYLAEHG